MAEPVIIESKFEQDVRQELVEIKQQTEELKQKSDEASSMIG